MKTIYCISGLGVDERLFRRMEIPGYQIKHVQWVTYNKGDTMSSYAAKLLYQIEEENPVIVGVSFGAMLACEIGELIPVKLIICISGSKTIEEIPRLYRFVGQSGLLNLIPMEITKHIFFILYYLFGVKIKEDKALLKAIVRDTDNGFIRWSTKALTTWERTVHTNNIIHIHGTKDRIIYPWCVKADYWIKQGGHLIVLLNYQEVNDIISGVLHADLS